MSFLTARSKEHDIGGEVRKLERLVVLINSPAMDHSQLLCAIPMENKTGNRKEENIGKGPLGPSRY